MRVAIQIGGHLSTAPRPYKEALALARAGHAVTVYGVWHDETFVERDRALLSHAEFAFVPVLDLRPRSVRARIVRFAYRASGRLARVRFQRSNHVSPPLFGYGVRVLLRHLLRARADLTVVHTEGGLWIGEQLLRAGLRVGVDFEDWFSEDLMSADRVARPIVELKRLEALLARACVYVTATSGAMAHAIATAYAAPVPVVVYNAFPRTPAKHDGAPASRDRTRCDVPSLHWFSQTLGPGRGLETLMEALPLVATPVEVHLRGHVAPERRDWLDRLVPMTIRNRVVVHPTVTNDELPHRIAEHDIGLALELPTCRSRSLTTTNKLFQYLEAGLAVVATDTIGQREVFDSMTTVGTLVTAGSAPALAAAIDGLAGDPAALHAAKASARLAADILSWEHQARRLVALAERAIQFPCRTDRPQ